MQFQSLDIPGAYLIDLNRIGDERGFFARLFCSREFEEQGLPSQFVQVNNSLSATQYTLRGLHYQLPPHSECKLLRCISGAVYDVILDLREESPSYGQHLAVELTAESRQMILVPEGCAHGFLTLKPDTEVMYFVTAAYAPEYERGVRWDDPAFSIPWPAKPCVISDKDASYPSSSDEKQWLAANGSEKPTT